MERGRRRHERARHRARARRPGADRRRGALRRRRPAVELRRLADPRPAHRRQVVGVVDLTGGHDLAGPRSLALVRACAAAIESQLLLATPARPAASPAAGVAVPGADLGNRLELLGTDAARLHLAGAHGAAQPPARGDRLAARAVADRDEHAGAWTPRCTAHGSHLVTVRAEMARLRRVLVARRCRRRCCSRGRTGWRCRCGPTSTSSAAASPAAPSTRPSTSSPARRCRARTRRPSSRPGTRSSPSCARPCCAAAAPRRSSAGRRRTAGARRRRGLAAPGDLPAVRVAQARHRPRPPAAPRHLTRNVAATCPRLASRDDAVEVDGRASAGGACMTVYAAPGQPGSPATYESRYDNWIGGEWVPPVKGQYFENPVPGHRPAVQRGRPLHRRGRRARPRRRARRGAGLGPDVGRRARDVLNRIADRIEANLEMLAVAETWDNGKPVRETLAADLPLAIDHFRYFAGAIRAQEGSLAELDDDTVAYHFHEPLGVVGQIIPWNFPLLMATLEARAGAGRGQRRRAQAGRADAGVDHAADGPHRRPAAGRRPQRRQRVRRRGGQAARVVRPDPQDRVHRRDDDRPADHAVRQPEHHPGHAGARRQEPEHLPRGRRARAGRLLRQGARGLHDVRAQPGRGLHLPVARAHPGVDLRRVPRRRDRAHEGRRRRATRSTPRR